MILYRLTDDQARGTQVAVLIGMLWVVYMALRFADRGCVGMAIGFACVMAVLFALIIIQTAQSRRLNAAHRENSVG